MADCPRCGNYAYRNFGGTLYCARHARELRYKVEARLLAAEARAYREMVEELEKWPEDDVATPGELLSMATKYRAQVAAKLQTPPANAAQEGGGA